MTSEIKAIEKSTSKYLKAPRERTLFYRCAILYIFALYVLPQYFGIPFPIFDFTAVRITIVILLLFIVFDYDRTNMFVNIIKNEPMSRVLLSYIIVLLYTMVLRTDINAFLNPIIEILELYLLIYVIKDCIGVDKLVELIIGFCYLLVILGLVEAVIKVSPFSYLETIKGIYTGRFIRAGHYRIMSSANHSLGYGLMLMTMLPFAGYDVEKKEFRIFRRPLLLVGLLINVFLTGSRSSLGIMFFALAMMIAMTDAKYLRESVVITILLILGFVALCIVLQPTSFGRYIMLQLTSLIDSLFGTSISVKYGADIVHLKQSANYRHFLKEIFKIDWLNPLLGKGRQGSFSCEIDGYVIRSIDNFYIAEYVRYAYPGMLSYIAFLAFFGIKMLIDIYKTKSSLIKVLFIGSVSYCAHLYIADSLQTLKYLYFLFAIYICCEKKAYVKIGNNEYFGKKKLRYIKK